MEAGRLNQRVAFYQAVNTPDGYGGNQVVRRLVCEVWAHVEAAQGDERMEGGRPSAVTMWRMVIRQRTGIVPTLIAVWKGVDLNVRQVTPRDEEGAFLNIVAESGVAV